MNKRDKRAKLRQTISVRNGIFSRLNRVRAYLDFNCPDLVAEYDDRSSVSFDTALEIILDYWDKGAHPDILDQRKED